MKSSPLRHPARLAGASLLRLQSDERLAELAIAGHEAAFDAIVVRYRTAVLRYCTGIVGAGRAEDATQQTLINAHDALQRTDEVRHLRSWLYRIAHNVSLNVLRGVRDEVSLADVSAAPWLAADGPAAEFERSERFRATVAALQELPERQRAALVLRELEGRSHEEIADALGVTKGSARQHVMRARIALRGAVTAVTPYPLIVRLADALSSSGGGAGWADAAVGAGAGATIAKLTAGVVATGALVGGAVGTERVVHGGHQPTTRAGAVIKQAAGAEPASAAVVVKNASPAVARSSAPASAVADRQGHRSRGEGSGGGDHHNSGNRGSTPRPTGSNSGPGSSGDDDNNDDTVTTPTSTSHRDRGRNESDGGDHDGHGGDDKPSSGDKGQSKSSLNSGSGKSGDESDQGRDGGGGGAVSAGDTHGGDRSAEDGGTESHSATEATTTTPTTTAPTVTTPEDSSGSGSSGSDDGSSGGSGPD